MKRIKLLFFIPNFNMGGAEKVMLNIVRELDATYFEIHIAVVLKEGPLYSLVPESVKVHELGTSKVILSVLKLRHLIKKLSPVMIYSTLFRTHIALDIALSSIKIRPIVILRNPTSPKLILKEKNLGAIEKFFLVKAYSNASHILAQTPDMKKELVQYFHLEEDRIQVFINPLDTASIQEGIKNIKNPFDVNRINVVAMGRLGKEKALDVLLKAFKLVVKKNHHYVLHIIGRDVGEKKSLLKLRETLNLEENVKFWDEQSNPYRFYYFSDLYVLSSIREGLPNTVLENLYMKKPIVATKCVPFMSELIKNGKNGFLVKVGDINRLAEKILQYKEIDVKSYGMLESQIDTNEFFKTCLNREVFE